MSLTELARAVALPEATLRVWQVRYGLPRAGRDGFDGVDLAQLRAVLRHRDEGMRLDQAVAVVLTTRGE